MSSDPTEYEAAFDRAARTATLRGQRVAFLEGLLGKLVRLWRRHVKADFTPAEWAELERAAERDS